MATVRDIVERAYRKIGVVSDEEPMTAAQAANGLTAFNMMMHGLELHGVNVLHVEATLPDQFALFPKFEEATVYMLASRVAPDNSFPAPDADSYYRALQAAYYQLPKSEMPCGLVYPASRRGWFVR